jgi:hypothetical protein
LAIVVSSRESCCAKQPSPRATMAALWATRAAASYTTPWDTIDDYRDLSMLPTDVDEPIIFFGGKNYVPLFCSLTRKVRGPRTVFYNSALPPIAPDCSLRRFVTATRTNWQYECADRFISAKA